MAWMMTRFVIKVHFIKPHINFVGKSCWNDVTLPVKKVTFIGHALSFLYSPCQHLGNVLIPVWRICILMLDCKGFILDSAK